MIYLFREACPQQLPRLHALLTSLRLLYVKGNPGCLKIWGEDPEIAIQWQLMEL